MIRPWLQKQLKRWRTKKSAPNSKSTRLKKQVRYQSLRLSKRLKPNHLGLLPMRRLIKRSLQFANQHRWRFLAHGLVFTVLYSLLIFGFSQQLNLTQIRSDLGDSLGNDLTAQLTTGLNLIGQLLSDGIQAFTSQGSLYSLLLFVLLSLATIWLIRALKQAPKKVKVREAYYFGPAQLIPFSLSLLVVALQLLPMFIINQIASTLRDNQVLLTAAEQILVVSVVLLLNLLSLYLVVGSIFSLIIVSLPGARPFQAIQSSFNITRYRRWLVVRYVLVMLFILSLVTIIIMIPIVLLATAVAEYLFYFLYVLLFIFVHIYLYELYRELIK